MPGLKKAAAPSSSSSPAPPERSRKEEKKPKRKIGTYYRFAPLRSSSFDSQKKK
jgi:hypothetical protein